jgi:DNA repair protein RecO (recombination protein O)
MVETAAGLVLRTRLLTETSLIVHWLSPACGRVATVAKGARRPKSPFQGKLDLFYLADFSFSRSRRSDLHTLREVSLRETHPALRRELGWLRQACYAAALLEQATEPETPLPAPFDLIQGFLRALPHSPPHPLPVFAFELKLLRELGLEPDLDQSRLTPGAREIVKRLVENNWDNLCSLRLSPGQVGELDHFLHGFLVYHLGRIPHNRAAALAAPQLSASRPR